MDNNQIIKYDNGQLTKVGNALAVTNKLLVLSAETYFKNGVRKAQEGKFDEAISDFSKAIELKPDFDLALARKYTLMGMLYDNEKKFEEAKIYFTKTIDLVDEYYAYYQLVIIFIRESKIDTAIHYLNIAISKFPENSQLYLIRANLKNDFLEMYSEAIDDYTKAIAIERKTEGIRDTMQEAYLGRAKARAEIGDKEGSNRDYTIINVNNTALRVLNEGLNEKERKMFGIE